MSKTYFVGYVGEPYTADEILVRADSIAAAVIKYLAKYPEREIKSIYLEHEEKREIIE